MKKLLILMLVLGLTSIAGAALQISIDGDFHPEDSTIILDVSDTVILDIWSTVPIIPAGEGEGMWALACDTACAIIAGGSVVISHADWAIGIEPDPAGAGIPLPEGHNGVMGYIYTFGEPIPADTAIYDEIVFHCESLNGPTPVSLYQLDDEGGIVGIWDTVTIHQIPEPASMLLLGLGGLLLRRRK